MIIARKSIFFVRFFVFHFLVTKLRNDQKEFRKKCFPGICRPFLAQAYIALFTNFIICSTIVLYLLVYDTMSGFWSVIISSKREIVQVFTYFSYIVFKIGWSDGREKCAPCPILAVIFVLLLITQWCQYVVRSYYVRALRAGVASRCRFVLSTSFGHKAY